MVNLTRILRHVLKVIIPFTIILCISPTIFALSLTQTQTLDFGKFIGGAGDSGTITISPSGARYATGGVKPLGSIFSTARFTIYGSPLGSYTLTLPASLTIISRENHMQITSLTSSVPVTGELPAGGTLSFTIGGTLAVNSTQKNSTYIGRLDTSASGN